MPKLPRGTAKASTKERAKKPDTKPAGAKRAAPKKKANGSDGSTTAPAKKPAAARPNGGRAGTKTRAKPKTAEREFDHQPVDHHAVHAPAGPKSSLTNDQRVLLGDLFAVLEEHAGEAA